MPITAVIFDYGCVLSLPPTPHDYEALRQATGLDAAAFEDTYWRHRDQYDLDTLDISAYWQKFGQAMGLRLSAEQVDNFAAMDCRIWGQPNHVMIEWLRVLDGAGLKTALISNMSRCIGDYLRRTAGWLALFDAVCFSGELALLKPDPAIYKTCLDSLGVPAAQTLFIDDRATNVAGARAAGMNAVEFHSVEQLKAELAPYGLVDSLGKAQATASSEWRKEVCVEGRQKGDELPAP